MYIFWRSGRVPDLRKCLSSLSCKNKPRLIRLICRAVEHKKGGIVGVIQSCTPVGESDDITLEIDSNNEVFGFLT